MILKQKQGSSFKEFELKSDNILYIKEKGFFDSKEWFMDIENIGYDKVIETRSRRGINIMGFFFMFIAIISWIGLFTEENPEGLSYKLIFGGLFMFVMGVICLKAPMSNQLILNGNYKRLCFILNSPSRKEVEEYVSKLIEKSKEITKNKYSRVDIDLPEETFINQINWLLQANYIDQDEYEKKKNEYKISKLLK